MKVRADKKGSPRRSKRTEAGKGAGTEFSKPNSLKGRKFFLDLKGFKSQNALEADLRFLGATIEKCFSKDVHWLVTSKGKPEDYARSRSQSRDGQSQATPSPFNLANVGVESPQAPSPTQPTMPLTRGKKMAQAANITKTYGSVDVMDNARRWNVRICHVEGAQKWLSKEIAKFPNFRRDATKDQVKSRTSKVKRLKAPYVKFEATNKHYRPVYQQFADLPILYLNSEAGQCPFELKAKNSKYEIDLDERAEAEERDPVVPDVPGITLSSQKEHRASDDRSCNKSGSLVSPRLITAGELRRMAREKQLADKKKGYCEMCNLKYDNIDKHVLLEQHKNYVRNTENYKSLDALIQEGETMEKLIQDLLNCQNDSKKKSREISKKQNGSPVKVSTPSKKRQADMTVPVKKPATPTKALLRTPVKSTSSQTPLKSQETLAQTPVKTKSQTFVKESKTPVKTPVKVKSLSASTKAGLKTPVKAETLKAWTPTSQTQATSGLVGSVEAKTPKSGIRSPRVRRPTKSASVTPRRCTRSNSALSSTSMFSPNQVPNKKEDPESETDYVNLIFCTPEAKVSMPKKVDRLAEGIQAEPEVTASTPLMQVPNTDSSQGESKARTAGVTETVSPTCPEVLPAAKTETCMTEHPSSQYTGLPTNVRTPNKGGKKQTRKLVLKKSVSLASDVSMHKLLNDEDIEDFAGFSKADLTGSVKSHLSCDNVTEIEADLHTQSEREWDYQGIEDNENQIGFEVVQEDSEADITITLADQGKDVEGINIDNLLGSIGMSDHSDQNWDEHMETFFSDQITKKQNSSIISLETGEPEKTSDSPLKMISNNTPTKTALKPADMYAYLSPGKASGRPLRIILSPCKLSSSPGKLLWSPNKAKGSLQPSLISAGDKSPNVLQIEQAVNAHGSQSNPDSVCRSPRKHSTPQGRLERKRRLMFSSPRHSDGFQTPTESPGVEDLWSGPAQTDKSKYAKEGVHYKPSTPLLSHNMVKKDVTPKSYLRDGITATSTPRVSHESACNKTPIRPKDHISTVLQRSTPSTTKSSKLLDEIDIDVQVDDDICFHFSPGKSEQSKAPATNMCLSNTLNTTQTSDSSRFLNKTMPDLLDNLDDPNMGNIKPQSQRRILKHSFRVKKSYNWHHMIKEEKMPHWRKKYRRMQKSNLTDKKSQSFTFGSSTVKRSQRVLGKSRKSAVKEKVSVAINPVCVTPVKKPPDDAPVSPRTRRNLLALVLGIRQHREPTSGEDAQNSEKSAKQTTSTHIQPPKPANTSTTSMTDNSKPKSQPQRSRLKVVKKENIRSSPLLLEKDSSSSSRNTSPHCSLGPYTLSVSLKKLTSPEVKRLVKVKEGHNSNLLLKRLASFNRSGKMEDLRSAEASPSGRSLGQRAIQESPGVRSSTGSSDMKNRQQCQQHQSEPRRTIVSNKHHGQKSVRPGRNNEDLASEKAGAPGDRLSKRRHLSLSEGHKLKRSSCKEEHQRPKRACVSRVLSYNEAPDCAKDNVQKCQDRQSKSQDNSAESLSSIKNRIVEDETAGRPTRTCKEKKLDYNEQKLIITQSERPPSKRPRTCKDECLNYNDDDKVYFYKS